MKYLNQLKNWLKLNFWKKLKLKQLQAEQKVLEKLEENPEAMKIKKEEYQACTHEKLKAISGAVYQCQNKKCYRVFEILMDKSYRPNDFVKEYNAIKDKLKGLKNENNNQLGRRKKTRF